MEEIGISENLHFLGGKPEIPDLISIFDVAVLASRAKDSPTWFWNTWPHQNQSWLPGGGNPEIVAHGQTGLLVLRLTLKHLQALSSPFWKIKKRAWDLVSRKKKSEERFSLDVMLRNYENLFEQVINSRGNISPAMLTWAPRFELEYGHSSDKKWK